MRKEPVQQELPLTCVYGTAWLDHFPPPVGTGKGCAHCAKPRDQRIAEGLDAPDPEPKAKRSRVRR